MSAGGSDEMPDREVDRETGMELLEGELLGLLAGGKDDMPDREVRAGVLDRLFAVKEAVVVELEILVSVPVLVVFACTRAGANVLALGI